LGVFPLICLVIETGEPLFALRGFGDRPACVFCEAKLVAYGLWCAYSKSKNKGIGVDSIHYLNDGLWAMEMA
jgi:hypothetical protein